MRIDERIGAALGKARANLVGFQPAESIPYGGVLVLLPFLISNGAAELPGILRGKAKRLL